MDPLWALLEPDGPALASVETVMSSTRTVETPQVLAVLLLVVLGGLVARDLSSRRLSQEPQAPARPRVRAEEEGWESTSEARSPAGVPGSSWRAPAPKVGRRRVKEWGPVGLSDQLFRPPGPQGATFTKIAEVLGRRTTLTGPMVTERGTYLYDAARGWQRFDGHTFLVVPPADVPDELRRQLPLAGFGPKLADAPIDLDSGGQP